MTTRNWKITSGSFAAPSNWDTGVPGAADAAQFGAATGAISDGGTISGLTTANGGNWTWTGQISAVAYNLNGADTLAVGARWTITGTPSQNGYMGIGSGTGNIGSLLMQAGASIVSTQPADSSNYGLFGGGGGGGSDTGTGTLTIDGGTVDIGKNGATIGQNGIGTMSLIDGATAHFASSNSNNLPAPAVGRKSNGIVTLDGKFSLTADGFVTIGRGGNATVNVAGGSPLTGGATASSAGGLAYLHAGDSTGSAAMTNAAFGGSGTLNVSQGSVVHALSGINVGYDGTTGTILVDGAGSRITADGTVQIGGGLQRVGGKGSMTIQNGAILD